jgi:hypothetical protein
MIIVKIGRIRSAWYVKTLTIEAPMEKKEYTPMISLALGIISILSLICCGALCFTLNQALKTERRDVSQARAQTLALNQALKIQEHDLSETKEQLASATTKIADAQKQNQALSQQITEMQSKLHENKAVLEAPFQPFQFHGALPAAAPEVAAADSVEGQLRAAGRHWERTEGQPLAGGYVQDILQGRMNQPKGRGSIGKVVFVNGNDGGSASATVDFGQGFIVGIACSELAPIRFIEPELR